VEEVRTRGDVEEVGVKKNKDCNNDALSDRCKETNAFIARPPTSAAWAARRGTDLEMDNKEKKKKTKTKKREKKHWKTRDVKTAKEFQGKKKKEKKKRA
jgi:hypothetical protein